ncbi:MAG: helix-turn-helix domain-containing protein [Candidatus Thermoplasmatota archaeon]|jgi:predicted transcriptional regulator|nr:helix-turn-helix domain-containing protein [Candidatus Thermoplasmatota archaeon]MCL5963242.1 helix-turn-helix domain-containing protein [Candidatus Thermoplasmatota archaeon]
MIDSNPLDLSILAMDQYNVRILLAINRDAKSVQELSERFDIPIAECYRKIHSLEKAGLIEKVGRILTSDGKRRSIYESTIKNINIDIVDTVIYIKVIKKNNESQVIEGKFSPFMPDEEAGGLLFKRKRRTM